MTRRRSPWSSSLPMPKNRSRHTRGRTIESLERRDLLAADTAGLFDPSASVFFLRNSNAPGAADITVQYGPAGAGWIPVVGDWDGNGSDTVGLYEPATSTFFLRNSNSGGAADVAFSFGPGGAGWTPLAGDFNGDGRDTVGLYNGSAFFLRNELAPGAADEVFGFGPGNSDWVPIAGDWDGDGQDTIGLYNGSAFFLRNEFSPGPADEVFNFGPAPSDWQPLAGDWNASASDTIGLYNGSVFFLRNALSGGAADVTFGFGPQESAWTALTGNWDGQLRIVGQPQLGGTLTLTGPVFDAEASSTTLVFIDALDNEVVLQADSVTATEVQVALPGVIPPELDVAAGPVTLELRQLRTGGSVTVKRLVNFPLDDDDDDLPDFPDFPDLPDLPPGESLGSFFGSFQVVGTGGSIFDPFNPDFDIEFDVRTHTMTVDVLVVLVEVPGVFNIGGIMAVTVDGRASTAGKADQTYQLEFYGDVLGSTSSSTISAFALYDEEFTSVTDPLYFSSVIFGGLNSSLPVAGTLSGSLEVRIGNAFDNFGVGQQVVLTQVT